MEKIVEIDYCNVPKHDQKISGDVFLQNVDPSNDSRYVCTLSDGLGSGVKANVLAMLTATMAQKFIIDKMDVTKAANTIRETLPICSVRKISYSTFTTVDVDSSRQKAVIVEFDNPPYILIRNGKDIEVRKKVLDLKRQKNIKRNSLMYSEINIGLGDRIVLFSDGVTQSGMGTKRLPLGWRLKGVESFLMKVIEKEQNISAMNLVKLIVNEAVKNDIFIPKDDITCAVLYYRKARKLLVISGPPFDKGKDEYMVERFKSFDGRKVICGGTTSLIISKRLGKSIKVNIEERSEDVPPTSSMEGANLVTEGMLTLNKVAKMLEDQGSKDSGSKDGATKLINMLLNSDCIYFLVGTAVNEAHQDPNMPVELGLRRITVEKIVKLLREVYLKKVIVEYV